MMISISKNLRAFLDTLAWSERTSISPATRCRGYDVIVTGIDGKSEIFTDFSNHPFAAGRKSKTINSKGLTSNASGRYQFMLRDWAHYRAQLSPAGLHSGIAGPLGHPVDPGAEGAAADRGWSLCRCDRLCAQPLGEPARRGLQGSVDARTA